MKLQILLLFYVINETFSINVISNMKKKYLKHKKFQKIMNEKENNIIFFDFPESEYPQTNATLRKINKELWIEYYDCLKETYAIIGLEKTLHPIALTALEGTSVTLQCQICISPAEANMNDIVKWYFNSSSNTKISNQLVEFTERILMNENTKSLIMYNVQPDQAGQYWCQMMDTMSSPYYLHIDNSSKVNYVKPDTALYARHAESAKILLDYNLKIYTTWSEWSECSICDLVGKKIRYGYCTLSLFKNSEQKNNALDKDINNGRHRRRDKFVLRKHNIIHTLSKRHEQIELKMLLGIILPVFKNKLPCKSKYTPKLIQDIPEVKDRRIEIMSSFCKVKCQKNVIFQIRDKFGHVLESANNSAGIYSMAQEIPDLPPPIERITLYHKYDTKLQICCPGNLHSTIPITWHVGAKNLIPLIIGKQSNGRIYLNSRMCIIFKKLRFQDANIYSCWQNNKVAGTVKLHVTGEIEIKTNYRIMSFGAIIILMTFIYVFWKVIKNHTRVLRY